MTFNHELQRQSTPESSDLLTTGEVAELLRAPVSTVRYWRHIGFGPGSFRLGRRVVYRREEVTRWLDAQEGAPVNVG